MGRQRTAELATDHFSYYQHVIASGVFRENLALEPRQCLTHKGRPRRSVVHSVPANLSALAGRP